MNAILKIQQDKLQNILTFKKKENPFFDNTCLTRFWYNLYHQTLAILSSKTTHDNSIKLFMSDILYNFQLAIVTNTIIIHNNQQFLSHGEQHIIKHLCFDNTECDINLYNITRMKDIDIKNNLDNNHSFSNNGYVCSWNSYDLIF